MHHPRSAKKNGKLFTRRFNCLPISCSKVGVVYRGGVITNREVDFGIVPTALLFHARHRNHGLKPVATNGIVPSGTGVWGALPKTGVTWMWVKPSEAHGRTGERRRVQQWFHGGGAHPRSAKKEW